MYDLVAWLMVIYLKQLYIWRLMVLWTSINHENKEPKVFKYFPINHVTE